MSEPALHESGRPGPAEPPAEMFEPSPPETGRARVSATSAVLRLLGAGLLTVAASTFMLQHWEHGNSWIRYACLLTHTALLAAAGLVCGLRVRENRAARTFFGLVLASVPVHFAVLGAVLRSAQPLDVAVGSNALWPISGSFAAFGLLAVGAAFTVLATRLSVRALCRPHEWALTRATLVLNAFVLVPVRAPDTVALLSLLVLGIWLVLDARLAGLGFAMRTPTARLARALVAVPLAVTIGRSLLWYSATAFAWGGFILAAGLWVFFAVPRIFAMPAVARAAQWFGTGCAGLGVAVMSYALHGRLALPGALAIPATVLPTAGLALALSFFMPHAGPGLRRFAAVLASGGVCANAAWICVDSALAGWVALGSGAALLLFGVQVGQRGVFMLGSLAVLVGAAQLLARIIEFGALRSWPALSAIGVVLIFGAALLERHAERLLRYGVALRGRLQAW